MTKDILLYIKGLQTMTEEQEDEIEVIIPGTYYRRNDVHYIKYDEVTEGFEGTTSNLLKIREHYLEVTKKGVTNTHMVFEEEKKNTTYYDTPFGNLMIGIAATKVQLCETENQIDVRVDYALDINDEHMADCTIDVSIHSKNSSSLQLGTGDSRFGRMER